MKTNGKFKFFTYSCIGSNDKDSKIRSMTGQTKYGCLEILVMPSKVNKGDDFRWLFTDIFSSSWFTVVYDLQIENNDTWLLIKNVKNILVI